MIDLGLQQVPAAGAAAHVRDATAQTFEAEVLQASLHKPVIVDFWAPWCGPCRQMMPLLEKAVGAAGGAVLLVKVDIDRSPELAQAMRIQSVPAVFAFFEGRPVDGFMGALPESGIRAFVDRVCALAGGGPGAGAADAVEKLMNEGDAFFRAGDYMAAMGCYGNAVDADPAHAPAMGGVGWCLYMLGDMDSVRELAAGIDAAQKEDARLRGLAAVLEAGREADTAALAARVEDDPADHAARLGLARAHLAAGRLQDALDALVEIIRRDREWGEQEPRRLMVSLLESMGPDNPLTAPARRKLSTVLFS